MSGAEAGSTGRPVVEARRFLHCCYCCDDADAAQRFFEAALGLATRMRSAGVRVDGSQLGFAGLVETDARFVYDRRGPRVSPAIEVQEWIEPSTTGEPYRTARDVGFHAIGVAVPAIEPVLERMVDFGSTVVGQVDLPGALPSGTAIVRDATGVAIDVRPMSGESGATRLAHVRATCSDLARSIDWYRALGFETLDEQHHARLDGSPFGVDRVVTASYARLRLPDEPFELVLVEWPDLPTAGRPYPCANHRGLFRVAIAVDDTRAAFERLRHAGWSLPNGPEPVELAGTPVPEMWIGFLTDPDGLTIELVERPRSAFR